jgi:hypothetical protein
MNPVGYGQWDKSGCPGLHKLGDRRKLFGYIQWDIGDSVYPPALKDVLSILQTILPQGKESSTRPMIGSLDWTFMGLRKPTCFMIRL